VQLEHPKIKQNISLDNSIKSESNKKKQKKNKKKKKLNVDTIIKNRYLQLAKDYGIFGYKARELQSHK